MKSYILTRTPAQLTSLSGKALQLSGEPVLSILNADTWEVAFQFTYNVFKYALTAFPVVMNNTVRSIRISL